MHASLAILGVLLAGADPVAVEPASSMNPLQQAAPPRNVAGPTPTDPWAAWPPPPLYRSDPRGYTVGLSINVGSSGAAINSPLLASVDGEVTVTAIVADNFSIADLDRLEVSGGAIGVQGAGAGRFQAKWRVEGSPGEETRRIIQRIPNGQFNGLVMRVEWPAIAFSSRVDEAAASRIPWPRRWAPETTPFLAPSTLIQSESPVFKGFVARIAGDQLHRTPVYLAAKDLVRKTILEFRNINGSTMVKETEGRIRGYRLEGAIRATESLEASPGDLVCVCVAVLRAAGIPARPVIGIDSGKGTKTKSKLPRNKTSMCVWAEFHLPGTGWVPFDPWQMRGQGLANKRIEQPWRWFGTIRDQNRRVAIAYDFAPFAHGEVPDWPAGWSWRMAVSKQEPWTLNAIVTPIMVSRGQVRP